MALCVNVDETAFEEYEAAMHRAEPFDVVIMDLTVPGAMGGREAIKRLRIMDPSVRAIVASGYSIDPVMVRAQAFGFCAGKSKPFGAPELIGVLERLLGATAGRTTTVSQAARP